MGASSKLNQSLLNVDYKKHTEIKDRIRKYTNDNVTGQVVPKKVNSLIKLGRLDPLRGDTYTTGTENEEYY